MNDATHVLTDAMGCGGPAFYFALGDHEPEPFMAVLARDVRLLDGTTPERHSRMYCGTCGRPLGIGHVRIEWLKRCNS